MTKIRKLAWAACLISTMAFGDGPPPPEQGVFIGPQVGTNLLTFAWFGGSSLGTGLAPGVRTSFYFPSFAIGGELGVSSSLGPFAGGQYGSLNLGGQVMPYLMKSGSTRTYGLLGVSLGLELAVPFASAAGLYPKAGVTLGLGIEQAIARDFTIGAEMGARTQLLSGRFGPQLTTTLGFTFVGQWGFGVPQAREKVPGEAAVAGTGTGTTGGPASAPKNPPSLTPPNPPAVFGRSTQSCTVYATDGWFEPTQGVWQDDPGFDDKKGKQLTRLPGDGIAYEAELNMVKNRDTLLFGVHHYRKNGEYVPVNDRNDIVLKGYSNCTVNVPVKFKFTRTNPVETRLIYTSAVVAQLPLEGPPAPELKPWTALLPVPKGIPPDKPFQFDVELSFTLKAELIRENGAQTGLEMTVKGYPAPTVGPKVHFAPVVLSLATNAEGAKLHGDAEYLAKQTAKYVPDLFPIAPDGLPTFVKPVAFFDGLEIPSKWIKFRRWDALVAALNDNLAASAFLDGAGRAVAVMRQTDYDSIFGAFRPEPQGEEAEGLRSSRSLSWKVILMPSTDGAWDTVAHELVHTLPEGWADDEMVKRCGKSYHNKKEPLAHGVKIDDGGAPAVAREVKDSKVPLMGPEVALSSMWITQCTYWHLLDVLSGAPPDPPVVLLRAWLGKEGSSVKGELKPVYNLMGHSDLPAGQDGPYAFVLKDAKGTELGRYPFTPRWNDIETKRPRELVSVAYRVPDLPGWSQVELVGPGGVLDRRMVSAKAPELVITAPADSSQATTKDGKIHVTWKGTGSGAPLLYSVSYSSDGGLNWVGQSFEQKGTAFDLKVDPKGTQHQVKIVATDGTRSAQAVTRFTPK